MKLTGDLSPQNHEPAPPPTVRKTTPLDPAEILKRLQELRQAKLLTEEEYRARVSGLTDHFPAENL